MTGTITGTGPGIRTACTGRRVRRLVAVPAAAAVLLTAAAVPAGAAPPTGDPPVGASAAAPQVDNTKWPAGLNWVIPGTPEFTARYTAGDSAGGAEVLAGTGCTAAQGGDPWRYTLDFFTNLGAILDAQATATGHAVMTLGDQVLPTAPWPGLATDKGAAVLTLGSGEKVLAGPGALLPMPDSGAVLTGGAGVCADTLRPYGTPAADAPFGFGFYTAPDQGSIDFLTARLAEQHPPTGTPGQVWANPAQFYDPVNGAENPLRSWDFSPLQVTDYCSDENNPFCLTAAFLRCPTGNGATDAEAAAVTACRTWNANVIILNQDIALTLLQPGVGIPADGALDTVDAAAGPGAQAPLDGWTAVAIDGKALTAAVKMFYVTLGAGALVGGLLAGGLPGLLVAAGVIGAASLVASQGIFGAVTCAQDFPRCAAAAGADGLVKTLGLIPDAARSAQVPDMTGPSMTTLLSTLGGVSAALVLLFFLISLLASVLTRRPAQLWPAFLGLIGWGAAMGLGGAFLTMLVAARDGVMTWLDTDGGGGTVLDGFPAAVQQSLSAIAADPSRGLLLAAFLSVFGMALGAVVWVVVWVSGQWIPLVVALLVLQSAGLAAPGMPRKWLSRGFSVLWTLLLTPVMVMIIWRVGKIGLESNTGYLGLLAGVLILLACAFSFLIVQRMLPMGDGTGLGIGAAMLTAGSWIAGRASAAGRPGPSREQLAQRQLDRGTEAASGSGDGGGGGGQDSGGAAEPAAGGDGGSGDGGHDSGGTADKEPDGGSAGDDGGGPGGTARQALGAAAAKAFAGAADRLGFGRPPPPPGTGGGGDPSAGAGEPSGAADPWTGAGTDPDQDPFDDPVYGWNTRFPGWATGDWSGANGAPGGTSGGAAGSGSAGGGPGTWAGDGAAAGDPDAAWGDR